MSYDFKVLSSIEFEELVRDLLQAELSIHLESFKEGPDDGIDLRYSTTEKLDDHIVIQCKHHSTFNSLYHALRKEIPKVHKLAPSRYIVATSVSCSPRQKTKIRDLFAPYCKSTSEDVYSREDLNNLLRKHTKVERQHFKLWLSSSEVLQHVLHSTIFTQSSTEVEHISQKVQLYVQNKSFLKAEELLENFHYCIISGISGIGKTTLAEMLLIHYIVQGYDVIKISQDIEEGFSILNTSSKQIFYYDDFLGQTNFDNKLNKNEDQRILRFINIATKSFNTRFLLTTREYILNQAKASYEKLATSNFDIRKCILDLATYTVHDRAKILFNHLYFSQMPRDFVQALLRDEIYTQIILHQNYNPRIIEWMTNQIQFTSTSPKTYARYFLDSLDNPSRVWEHAFENQISSYSRTLLISLVTFSGEVLPEVLFKAFSLVNTSSEYNVSKLYKHFQQSLKELEDNFIRITTQDQQIFVEFHNPSIRDFLNYHLERNEFEFCLAMERVSYFNQLDYFLHQVHKKQHLVDRFVSILKNSATLPGDRLGYVLDTESNSFKRYQQFISIEERVQFFVLAQRLLKIDLLGIVKPFLDQVLQRLENQICDEEAITNLLHEVKLCDSFDPYYMERLVLSAKNLLIQNLISIEDFEHIAEVYENYEDHLSDDDYQLICYEFDSYLEDMIYEITSLHDWYEVATFSTQVDEIRIKLDTNVDEFFNEVEHHLDMLEKPVLDINEDEGIDFVSGERYNKSDIKNIFDLLS